jgi:hypothetical protein
MDIDTLIKDLATTYGYSEVKVGDKFVLKFSAESDIDISPMEHINDCDCWGRVAWGARNRDTGRQERPEGFTGAACKVYQDGYDVIWWEPYRDDSRVYNSPEDRRSVERLLADGFYYVCLDVMELCTVIGADGREVGRRYEEVASFGMGGIDTLEGGYGEDLVGQLLYEANIDQEWLDSHSEGE